MSTLFIPEIALLHAQSTATETVQIKPVRAIDTPVAIPRPALAAGDISRIIEMAWEDRTPFEDIEREYGLNESAVIALMRREMKASSFRMWRKRMTGRTTKHRVVQQVRMQAKARGAVQSAAAFAEAPLDPPLDPLLDPSPEVAVEMPAETVSTDPTVAAFAATAAVSGAASSPFRGSGSAALPVLSKNVFAEPVRP